MRTTKALLCAAALAVGALTSMAQVYSLNVVGYVNEAFVPGFNLICNPLNAPDNHLGQIAKFPAAGDGALALVWDPATQDFSATTLPTYSAGTQTWSPDYVLSPGAGVIIYAPAAFTNTFVGDVKQGSTSVPFVVGYNAVASPAPIGGDLNAVVPGLGAEGDLMLGFDQAAQDFTHLATYSGGTWTSSFNVGVGDGLFYFANAAGTWVRNFTVQ